MKISVVIPVYNEVATLEKIVGKIRKLDLDVEIILVDDASTDGSGAVISQLAKLSNVFSFSHEVNKGKGASLRTGFGNTTGDVILVQDADLEYSPSDYKQLIEPIENDRADVVYGSRFIGGRPHRVLYFWHLVGNRVLTLFSNMFTNLNLTDMEVCYKAFRREIIQNITLFEDGFGFEPEVTARIAQYRKPNGDPLRIYEVGVSYNGRTYSEGKKINWKDGVWGMWCIVRYNLWKQ